MCVLYSVAEKKLNAYDEDDDDVEWDEMSVKFKQNFIDMDIKYRI